MCFSVNGSVCLVCLTVFVNMQYLGVVVILLFYIMEVLSVGGGALLENICVVPVIILLWLIFN